MTARHYPFALPHTISAKEGFAISMGLNMPQVHDALPSLKPDLVAKLQRCSFWQPETFTKADLDGIPDALWAKLAPHLG